MNVKGESDLSSRGQQHIERLFVQLKDLSEMMIDLAYSALIYNNMEIAEDVLELEDYIDQLYFKFQQAVLKQQYPPEPVFCIYL